MSRRVPQDRSTSRKVSLAARRRVRIIPPSHGEKPQGRIRRLARTGLRVLQTFSREHPQLTLSEVGDADGADAGHRPAIAAHARVAWLHRPQRPAVPAAPQSPRDRHRLSQRDQRRSRAAAVSSGRRQRAGRQLLGHGPRRRRHRLHRARVAESRDPADGGRRFTLSGVSDLDGPRAARVSAAPRRSTRTSSARRCAS